MPKITIFSMAYLTLALAGSAQMPPAHFHHIHLNTTEPAAAIDFYTSKFDCEKAKFAGEWDGVWAQKAWVLFKKVAAPPPAEISSTIWHFGWGAEDMQATYQKQLNSGTKFNTPLTDISDLANSPGFYYAYVDGPDHALIELNTAAHHRLGHLHLLSTDPIGAGEWYVKYFGVTRRGSGPVAAARYTTRTPFTIRATRSAPACRWCRITSTSSFFRWSLHTKRIPRNGRAALPSIRLRAAWWITP